MKHRNAFFFFFVHEKQQQISIVSTKYQREYILGQKAECTCSLRGQNELILYTKFIMSTK